MIDSKFKIGDQVVLISGGPTMTIESLEEDYNYKAGKSSNTYNSKVKCVWFDPKDITKPYYQTFHQDLLKAV